MADFFDSPKERQLELLSSQPTVLSRRLFDEDLKPFSLKLCSSPGGDRQVFEQALRSKVAWSDWPSIDGLTCLTALFKCENEHLVGVYAKFLAETGRGKRLGQETVGAGGESVFVLCLQARRLDLYETLFKSIPPEVLCSLENEAGNGLGPVSSVIMSIFVGIHVENYDLLGHMRLLEEILSWMVQEGVQQAVMFGYTHSDDETEFSTALHAFCEMTENVVSSQELTKLWIGCYVHLSVLVDPVVLGLPDFRGVTPKELFDSESHILPGILKDTSEHEAWTFSIRVEVKTGLISIWNSQWAGRWRFASKKEAEPLSKGCGAFFAVLHSVVAFETEIEEDRDIYYTKGTPITFVYEGDENPYFEHCVFEALTVMGAGRLLGSYGKVVLKKGATRKAPEPPPRTTELVFAKEVERMVFPGMNVLDDLVKAFEKHHHQGFERKIKKKGNPESAAHPTLRKMAADLGYT